MLALYAAAVWSLGYLGLALAWWSGAPGNPADPEVDPGLDLSLLGLFSPTSGAAVLAGLGAAGAALAAAMLLPDRRCDPDRPRPRWPAAGAAALGVVLAVLLPDYRLLAGLGYTPLVLALRLVGLGPDGTIWDWPEVHQLVVTAGGLLWFATAIGWLRRTGLGDGWPARWTTPEAAARWGRWAVAVAVAVPLGYAATRFAWALGIAFGISDRLLDEIGPFVWVGAGLGALAVGGAVLTLGLVQRWGEVFPRWIPGLRGRPVPVNLAVLPACTVAVVVTSAGAMFLRFAVLGEIGDRLPGAADYVAAWLPEMFWPLWGVALAAAAAAYRLRRAGRSPEQAPATTPPLRRPGQSRGIS